MCLCNLRILVICRNSSLQLIPVPTPRWPDLLCVYHQTDKLLFTSKLFSAHVAPSVVNTSGETAADTGGWDMYGQDWRHFYECMLAPVAKQAAGLSCTAVVLRTRMVKSVQFCAHTQKLFYHVSSATCFAHADPIPLVSQLCLVCESCILREPYTSVLLNSSAGQQPEQCLQIKALFALSVRHLRVKSAFIVTFIADCQGGWRSWLTSFLQNLRMSRRQRLCRGFCKGA